jgi:hypothetical protein
LIVKVNAVGPAVPALFMALTLMVDVPAIFGVPLKRPAEESVKPVGRVEVVAHVIGVLPFAWN